MKYLKLFEMFNEVEKNEFFLHLISKGKVKTPNGMVSDNEVDEISESELLKIKSVFKSEYIYSLGYISVASRGKKSKVELLKQMPGSEKLKVVTIIKLKDEWFLAYFKQYEFQDKPFPFKEYYYKCDQIDGLLSCLNKVKQILWYGYHKD